MMPPRRALSGWFSEDSASWIVPLTGVGAVNDHRRLSA
ncbi:hypothetical protein GFS60_06861 (plasmid) [Rhodococcus sp. WAY2]|nr:hypothetical protein GFS60_06861 [Rhodococcus sp. WAY2]